MSSSSSLASEEWAPSSADDEQRCDEFHRPETDVRNPAGANPAPARAKARTLRIRRHAAHSGPGASPRRHAIPTDQYRSSSVAREQSKRNLR